jgi:integrase
MLWRRRLPEVLTREEVGRVLGEMSGPTRLMATLLYGSGLRLMECCRLRVKDLDLAAVRLVVREGKGGKDRTTLLPEALFVSVGLAMLLVAVLLVVGLRGGARR